MIAEIDDARARETQLEITGNGGRAVSVVADVRDAGVAEALVTAARDAFDRVDVLVNNVGHYGGARKAFHEQTDDEWDDLYRVNLGHVLACSRAVLPVLLDAGRRREHRERLDDRGVPRDPDAARCTRRSRSAITGLTRSLAVEYGRARDPRQRDRARRHRDAAGAVLAFGPPRRRAPDPDVGAGSAASARPTMPRASRCSSRRSCRASSPARRCTSTAARSRRAAGSRPKKAAGPTAPPAVAIGAAGVSSRSRAGGW